MIFTGFYDNGRMGRSIADSVLLNYIDEIDSRVYGIREFMAADNSGESWTSYHKLLGRHFYTGKT